MDFSKESNLCMPHIDSGISISCFTSTFKLDVTLNASARLWIDKCDFLDIIYMTSMPIVHFYSLDTTILGRMWGN